jgi:TPR repeat protein
LSVAYAQGDGLPRDKEKSRYWLTMSADYDYKIAMQALALELDGVGGQDSSASQRSKLLMKEASDHRLMNWNTSL